MFYIWKVSFPFVIYFDLAHMCAKWLLYIQSISILHMVYMCKVFPPYVSIYLVKYCFYKCKNNAVTNVKMLLLQMYEIILLQM